MNGTRSWHARYSPGVPPEPDFERITLPEVLTRTAGWFPDRTALIFMGKKISYRELESLVNRCARALAEIGVKQGDRVALLLPNMPQFVIAAYAALRIGAVVVPCNPLAAEEELARQFNDSGCAALVTLDLLFPRALALKGTTGIRSLIACHITDYLPFPGNKLLPYFQKALYRKIAPEPGIHEFLPFLHHHSDTPVENRAHWDEVAALIHTEGTTGTAKGVLLTHANMAAAARPLRSWLADLQDGAESILAIFPFFHPAGWTGVQNLAILAGWTDVLVPHPDLPAIIEIMQRHKPTLLAGPPGIYRMLLLQGGFRKAALSSVKGFITGAAPVPAGLAGELRALRTVPVINLYGLAETCAAGTATPWGVPEKPGTAGLPLPGTDLRIVDAETGTRELPAGEAGEICLKGPQVMQGYSNGPAPAAALLKDGWFRTGDVGSIDPEGYLTVLDRKEDLIVTAGRRIYPGEIDSALLTHPEVLEACTIGAPDGQGSMTVKSYVVLKPGQTAKVGEMFAHCRERLPADKVPQSIEFIDALPKSTLGKVLRREVKATGRK
ncbi:MAG: AMP-binding protein [Syntrophales bacterium]